MTNPKNKISYSLSNTDIMDLMDGKCNLMTYDKIKDYDNIQDILGKYKKCVLLYKTSHNYGHWCCLYEYNGIIYFFDSYGNEPNEQLKFNCNFINKSLDQDHNHLIQLLINSKKPIEYNEYILQDLKPNISTCGKWCIFRLKHPYVSVDDFNKLFTNKKKKPDYLINELVRFD